MTDRQRLCGELFAEYRSQARLLCIRPRGDAHARRVQNYLFSIPQPEAHVKPRQGQPLHQPRNVPQLGRIASHELTPRRNIEEQVADFHRRPGRMRRRFHLANRASVDADLRRVVGIFGSRGQPQSRNRTDGRQRFASEP